MSLNRMLAKICFVAGGEEVGGAVSEALVRLWMRGRTVGVFVVLALALALAAHATAGPSAKTKRIKLVGAPALRVGASI